MYEQHFGLNRRPFSVKAAGADVFVGPQTAKTMSGFRKALTAQDAVVTVSGPVGTGKTTLVERALDAIGTKYKTIRVGRMQMNSNDVLESLLIVLGVQDRPAGTIQRFAALRRKLRELQDAGTRVFIIVEDALRAGAETLAELEALTVADAGESDGASIILMGDERLFDFMRDPQLAQMQQRVRQRHRIKPLCAAEMRGYLKHGLRVAGGEYDRIFDKRSAELLHHLSDGIPRVANTIVESVLTAAAEKKLDHIDATFIASVASDEFGLSADDFDFSSPDSADEPLSAPEPIQQAVSDARTAPTPASGVAPQRESAAASAASEQAHSEINADKTPSTSVSDDAEPLAEPSEDIPQLIDDTLPDLAILSQRYATLIPDDADAPIAEKALDSIADVAADPKPQPAPYSQAVPASSLDASSKPETVAVPVAAGIPELTPEMQVDAELIAALTPETEVTPQAIADNIPELSACQDYAPLPVATPLHEVDEQPQAVADNIPELSVEAKAEPAAVAEPIAERAAKIDAGPRTPVANTTELDSASDGELESVPEQSPEQNGGIELEPELIAAINPDLKPKSGIESAPVAEAIPEVQVEIDAEPDSALELAPQQEANDEAPTADSGNDEPPEWDRDPTLAELKPDLEALEKAMAFTHGAAPAAAARAPAEKKNVSDRGDEIDDVPEITLDKSIETGLQNQLVDQPGDNAPTKPAKKAGPELDRIAANIANAKTIDDIDDMMAETLFGTGISMIAEALKAKAPGDESANDQLQLVADSDVNAPSAVAQHAAPAIGGVGEEISIETLSPSGNKGLDPTASQRLKTVRALNAGRPAPARPRKATNAAQNTPAAPQPIEDQINTSITQTLKALEIANDDQDDEQEETQKSGFFSRFRRS